MKLKYFLFSALVATAGCRQAVMTTPLCGTLAENIRQIGPDLSTDHKTQTAIRFDDGRSYILEGIVEITMTPGKFYSFTINKKPQVDGSFILYRTRSANACAYDRDTSSGG